MTGEYLSTQSEDYNFHYQSYLRQISLYVRENHRTDYFANEIIERVKRHKVILDDLKGNSLLYGKYYLDDSEELQLSLIEIDKIIEAVNKNGM